MQKSNQLKAGERNCAHCKEPMPAMEVWSGRRSAIYCDQPLCRLAAQANLNRRYIYLDTVVCEAPDCAQFVPEGSYDRRTKVFVCSAECWRRRQSKGTTEHVCACCGEHFVGSDLKRGPEGLFFKSSEHYGRYISAQRLERKCGHFLPLLNEYIRTFAMSHYRKLHKVRLGLGFFFEFLTESAVLSIDDVDSKMVSAYLAWGRDNDHKSVATCIGFVTKFFDWMIVEGRRMTANPVVRGFHTVRQPKRKPRPFEDDTLQQIWELLNVRGNERLRLVAALAEESGLRIGEISNLRLEDINLKNQTVFVRLPNKNMEERYGFFHDKTKRYLQEWSAVRKALRAGDYLLHNQNGKPCKPDQIREEFSRVLLKEFRGKKQHEVGFDEWSGHRFRHTMASLLADGGANAAAIMATGGWNSFSAMSGYARVSPDTSRRSYEESMRRGRASRKKPKSTEVGLLEYVAQSSQARSVA